jgi:hypothetical protein
VAGRRQLSIAESLQRATVGGGARAATQAQESGEGVERRQTRAMAAGSRGGAERGAGVVGRNGRDNDKK